MKLKATGVIEPDFKIKEGKKLKGKEESPRKEFSRQNRLARGADRGRKKKVDENSRAAYLLHMRKQESSLESDDAIKRKRANSIDSDELNLNDKFLYQA